MIVLVLCGVVVLSLTIVEKRVGRSHGGFAESGQLKRVLGARSVQRRAKILRPSVTDVTIDEVGVSVGRAGRQQLYGSIEDSYLILGPPRSGKGTSFLIPAVLRYPGPAVVTSTRDDLVRATAASRAKEGPVWLFDPAQLITDEALPRSGWNPVSGCTDPLVAILRARAIVGASRSSEGVTNSEFWRASSETVLRCLLHAAAIDGKDMRDVRKWVAQQSSPEPMAILRTANAAHGWLEDLAGFTHLDERTRSNVFASVQMALSSLADPRVLDAACHPTNTIDINRFLDERGTIYLVGQSDAQFSLAPLIVALVEAIVDRARRRAAASPQGRLDPPLGLFLDEAAQIAPLPSLPKLVADGGGSGITPMVVLQSLAQARDRWGQQAADAIWDASTVRLVFGGLGNDGDLQKISRLCGERDHATVSRNRDGSSAVSTRSVPVMTAADIRGLQPSRALLIYKGLRPTVVRLTPHFAGGSSAVELIGRLVIKSAEPARNARR